MQPPRIVATTTVTTIATPTVTTIVTPTVTIIDTKTVTTTATMVAMTIPGEAYTRPAHSASATAPRSRVGTCCEASPSTLTPAAALTMPTTATTAHSAISMSTASITPRLTAKATKARFAEDTTAKSWGPRGEAAGDAGGLFVARSSSPERAFPRLRLSRAAQH